MCSPSKRRDIVGILEVEAPSDLTPRDMQLIPGILAL